MEKIIARSSITLNFTPPSMPPAATNTLSTKILSCLALITGGVMMIVFLATHPTLQGAVLQSGTQASAVTCGAGQYCLPPGGSLISCPGGAMQTYVMPPKSCGSTTPKGLCVACPSATPISVSPVTPPPTPPGPLPPTFENLPANCKWQNGGPWVAIGLYKCLADGFCNADPTFTGPATTPFKPGSKLMLDYFWKPASYGMKVTPENNQVLEHYDNYLKDHDFHGSSVITPQVTTTYVLTPETRPDCAVSYTVNVDSLKISVTPTAPDQFTSYYVLNTAVGGPVAKVEYYYQSMAPVSPPVLITTKTEAPWPVNWDISGGSSSQPLAAGAYTVFAKAYDADNNVAVSAPATVTLYTPVLTSPTNNAVLSGTIPLGAKVTGPVSSVTYTLVQIVNNAAMMNVVATATKAPWNATWDTKTVPNGTYQIRAEARDAAGVVGSALATVTIGNAVPLTIDMLPLGTTGNVVRNQRDVPLLRFKATASSQDVVLHTIRFMAMPTYGGFNIKRYIPWKDTNNDGIPDTMLDMSSIPGTDDNTAIIDMGDADGLIRKGTSVTFEIRGNITRFSDTENSSFVPNSLQVYLGNLPSTPPSPEAFIQAYIPGGSDLKGISTNGVCDNTVSCAIVVNTIPSIRYTISTIPPEQRAALVATIVKPQTATVGTPFDVQLQITNNGPADVTDGEASIFTSNSSSFTIVANQPPQADGTSCTASMTSFRCPHVAIATGQTKTFVVRMTSSACGKMLSFDSGIYAVNAYSVQFSDKASLIGCQPPPPPSPVPSPNPAPSPSPTQPPPATDAPKILVPLANGAYNKVFTAYAVLTDPTHVITVQFCFDTNCTTQNAPSSAGFGTFVQQPYTGDLGYHTITVTATYGDGRVLQSKVPFQIGSNAVLNPPPPPAPAPTPPPALPSHTAPQFITKPEQGQVGLPPASVQLKVYDPATIVRVSVNVNGKLYWQSTDFMNNNFQGFPSYTAIVAPPITKLGKYDLDAEVEYSDGTKVKSAKRSFTLFSFFR